MRAVLVAALIGLAAALTAPAGANAAACWQRVLDDWRDGRLDAVYPVQCYRDALKNMPEDLRVYGAAGNDIENALSRALARSAARSRATTHVAAHKPAVTVTSTATQTAPAAPAPDRARTLAGHSKEQPKLRLADAPPPADADSPFPLWAVVAGALALGAALVALASLRRKLPPRLRH
jgi:hypothetical protein